MTRPKPKQKPAARWIVAVLAILVAPACTMKITRHYFVSDAYKRYDRGFGFGEGEFSTPRFLRGRMDFAFQGGVKTMEEKGTILTTEGELPQFTRDLIYVSGSPRLFPVGSWKGVAPFVSGGLGYYRYYVANSYGGKDVTCPHPYDNAFECQELKTNRTTLASGLGKHVAGGIYLPLSKAFGKNEDRQMRLVLGLEMRYYFLNLDPTHRIDLSGRQALATFGLAWK